MSQLLGVGFAVALSFGGAEVAGLEHAQSRSSADAMEGVQRETLLAAGACHSFVRKFQFKVFGVIYPSVLSCHRSDKPSTEAGATKVANALSLLQRKKA